jgi:uncharacterized protein
MRRPVIALVALAALAFAGLGLAAWPALAKPPIWTAHGPRSTLVLFGSVHLLPLGLDWEPAALADALGRADELWFELPIDQATDVEAARLAALRGVLPAGDRLANHLNLEQQARLSRVAQGLAIPPEAIDRMRPWLAEVSLSLAADESAGAMASQGVEQQVQGAAPASARRRALEDVRQQIGFLADAAPADQIASLDQTLHEIEERPQSFRQVVAEWMAGDLASLDTDALEPLRVASPALYARLITQRNQNWADTLSRRLARPGVTAVIVGMGHLIGPGGVPALLRAKGFRVDGP